MHRHFVRLEGLLLLGQCLPRHGIAHFAWTQYLVGIGEMVMGSHLAFHRGKRALGEAKLFLLLPASRAYLVPALLVTFAIAFYVFRAGVQGEVRRREGEVVEEWFVGVLLGMLLQGVDGMVGDCVGDVELRTDRGGRLLFVVEKMGLEAKEPVIVDIVGAVEAVGERQAVDMPFAGVIGPIACRFQHLRQQVGPIRPIPTLDARQAIPTHLLGIIAREQGGTGRPATGGIVKLGEAEPVPGQAVKMRGLYFTTVASEVGIPHVVRHYEKDVRVSARDLQA